MIYRYHIYMLYNITFIIIILLILTNGITDAPNAIATLVGTKVVKFKKAALLSAVFNLVGIIMMSFINISVADNISSMIKFENSRTGMIGLASAMISVIIFALIAMQYGIPTSETHALVAGLTGSGIALLGLNSISLSEWKNVILGLIWSILGTYLISRIISKKIKNKIQNIEEKTTKRYQILSCCGMSFIHGAQDGQKFIGTLIIFSSIIRNVEIPNNIDPLENIGIIMLVAIIMAIGVSIGGKKIVQNIGSDIVELNNSQALCSDISTILTLFIASIVGFPVSTTHVKTVSVITEGKENGDTINMNSILNIIKAWIYTFPVCGIISYIICKIFV